MGETKTLGYCVLAVPEPASNTSHGQRIQVAPGVVVETFDITDQGDGVLPDINRVRYEKYLQGALTSHCNYHFFIFSFCADCFCCSWGFWNE